MNNAYNKGVKCLGQYFTPQWVAEELVEAHLSDLKLGDLVIEPSCGNGSFLEAIWTRAIGVEIDPVVAEMARERTGRKVITGDFCVVELPEPTAIIGNPPFSVQIVERFLDRAHRLLPHGGFCGFILSAHILQNGHRVSGWADRWGIKQEMLPRQLFTGLAHPLCFASFIKGRTDIFQGFRLYREFSSLGSLKRQYEALLHGGRRQSVWRAFVHELMADLGGMATLEQLYQQAATRRPTKTLWWKEKIRQTLSRYGFQKDGDYYKA